MAYKKGIMPRKKPVQERSKFTVEAIFQAAVQVFTEYGYAGATTDLIADRAGVSIGTLYQYFPNKKAILVGIWDRNMEDVDKGIDLLLNSVKWDDGLDPLKIQTIVKAVFELHKDSIKPHLFFESVPQPDFIQKKRREKESIAVQLFTAIIDHSYNIRTRKPEIAARMIYEVMEQSIHRYLTHFQHEMSEDELVIEISDIISRYLFVDNPC